MKVLVDLNSKVNSFQITETHKKRLVDEFPEHEFIFTSSYKEFKERLVEAEAALVWLFPERLFENAENLTALYTPAAGKDWVAEDPTGKVKTYFSSFHGDIIVESFLSMLLYFNNQLGTAVKNQSSKTWNRNAFSGRRLLKSQNLLILGYGSIGEKCASLARAYGMALAGVSRSKESTTEVSIVRPEELYGVIGTYDHVLNLLPGNESTLKWVGKKLISSMKEGVCFYNFGRGATVDEDSLIVALKSGRIAFAGLDVTDVEPLDESSPLWNLPNVLLTPHSSCCYEDYLHLFIDELHRKL
ncbi:MAG: hypothetical protein MK132_07025 [Lentisphaerales bacterium]|nr:hypothetical protein [Lentisphaerales bacterium]